MKRFPGGFSIGLACVVSVFWIMFDTPPRPVQAAVSKERLAAGASLFHEKGCVFCHGEDLGGTEKAPYLNSIGRQWTRPQIEKQIREGGGGMPAFGEILAGDDVATLVDFLASRRKPVPKGWKPWGNAAAAAKPTEP